jgi:hypothetical protein
MGDVDDEGYLQVVKEEEKLTLGVQSIVHFVQRELSQGSEAEIFWKQAF